jgi:hypothetical protein
MAEIPPWITPQQSLGLGNLYAEGIKLRHDQAQIAQRYQLAQQELDQRQAQNEREAMVQEQRLKIEKSYKDQMVSMQQQELEQKRRMDEIKTQEAAEKFAAQARFRDLIQQAGPNANVPQLLFQSGAAADMSGQGQAALYKAGLPRESATVPQEKTYGGQSFVQWTDENGNTHLQQVRIPAAPASARSNLPQEFTRKPGVDYVTSGGAFVPAARPEIGEMITETVKPGELVSPARPAKPGGWFAKDRPAVPAVYSEPKTNITRRYKAATKTKKWRFDPETGELVPIK